MPIYDVVCPSLHEAERWARWDERELPCETCGQPTERVWKGRRNVISDEWAGGRTFENGFATPQTFYSPSEYRKALASRGLQVRGDGEEGKGCALSATGLKKAEEWMRELYPCP